MTASAILERAAREGVEVSLCGNGKLKACGPRAALAKWLPTLKAMKPAIIDSATTAARERERIEAQLSRLCPDDVSPERWERAQAGAVRFGEQWAAQAMHLGWTFEELFDLAEPFANVSLQGAAWFVGDATVVAVSEAAINLRTASGATQRIYRRSGPVERVPEICS